MEQGTGENIQVMIDSLLEEVQLEHVFQSCKDQGFACALYRAPKANSIHLIIDLSAGADIDKVELDELDSGFVFHPFSKDKHTIRFIRNDVHLVVAKDSDELELAHANCSTDQLTNLFLNATNKNSGHQLNSDIVIPQSSDEERDAYINLTSKAIEEIDQDRFQKTVLARRKSIDLPESFDPTVFFKALEKRYHNAFVYLVSIPSTGMWTGATPETLININREGIFKTTALAATQSMRPDIDLEDTTWSQKDIEEQAMVSRYIINCFKKIRLREFEEIGPRTHLSGNLVHLKTDYIVDMEQVAFPQLGTVMLDLLHPTSAVCGMPKEPAATFLLENEGFDRAYFSGYLGPVHVHGETDIFVNLRCMEMKGLKALLYAGAGIIANSNPSKEWNETEIKMETLLKVLRELD